MMKNKYKVLIISCWILLILAFGFKLLGANVFDIKVENENIGKIFKFIDNHDILKAVVMCITSLILNSIVILAILKQKFYTLIQALIIIPVIIFTSLSYWFSQTLNFVLGFAIYALPIIWLKKKWYRALIGIALIMAFELISLATKNWGNWNLDNNDSFVTLVMQIDTLIMSILYYLYSNLQKSNKEV